MPVKSIEQQELAMLVQLRDQLVAERTAKANQIRGFAREFGLNFPRGIDKLLAAIAELTIEHAQYSTRACLVLAELALDLTRLRERIEKIDRDLAEVASRYPAYARLQAIPGIGPVIAAALIAKAGDGTQFANGRQMAAWVGLVPRQNGTGGKVQLGHITKAGDRQLRRQLIHGARTVIRWLDKQNALLKNWAAGIIDRRGKKRAIVAYANKLARLAFRALTSEEAFDIKRAFGASAS